MNQHVDARDLSVAVDCGGTFTDIALVDRVSGDLWITKTSSTPHDPSEGFIEGVRKVLRLAGVDASDLNQVCHGTTVATNAILESRGAPSAMLTTTGFKHVLEIGRHDIPRDSNMYTWIKPRRPVAPERIFEVGGRIDYTGEELSPLDEGHVREAVAAIREIGIKAVAVCLLHSYANNGHELRARQIIQEMYPEAMVSISSEVLPVFREYERSMATLLNVYVMPLISVYVAKLQERLTEEGVRSPLLLMKSSGGVTGVQTVRREPIVTALSGPAAGIAGTIYVGQQLGLKNIISIDIGGTSADVCLIKDGKSELTTKSRIGDWPLTVPMLDITTIGAGGGSIAKVSAHGVLSVGPESAGASPGPACYGRGGTLPTVTDAHCILGNLLPHLLDGELALDRAAAEAAIREHVAAPLSIGVEEAADGILRVINNNMFGAIRLVSIERGHDPRDFVLLPFGGAGPLHGGALARLLGIRTIVIPPWPGVLSGAGLLMTDLRSEHSRTAIQRPPNYNLPEIHDVFSQLEQSAARWFEEEGIAPARRRLRRYVSMRYENQGFELNVEWPEAGSLIESLERSVELFHKLHLQLYTFNALDANVELVTFFVEAIGEMPRPPIQSDQGHSDAAGAQIGTQNVWFDGKYTETRVYDRKRLRADIRIEGPAILQQLDTTTVILPGQECTTHASGCIIVREQ